MQQDGDTSAPQEPVAPVTDAPEAPTYESHEDLDFELTPEQEQDYVNQILNEGHYTPKAVEPVAEEPVAPVAPVEPVAASTAVEPVAEPAKPDTAPTEIAAPQTDDLWIEVDQVVIDDLGDETTKTVKLSYDPTDPSSFIPDDFTAKNTKQLADIMDAKAEMAKIYADREGVYNTAQQEQTATTQQQAQLDAWDAEIQDLVDVGAIPNAKEDADGYTAKTDAVFEFMTAENTKRLSEGRPMITTFGTAYTMYENNEAVKAAKEAEKQEIIDTKQKGGMIGGGSASSGGAPQKSAYVAGSARNIWDIKVE